MGSKRPTALVIDASDNLCSIAGNVEVVGETNEGVFCRLFRQKSLDPCQFGFPRETNTLLATALLRWLSCARSTSLAPLLALPAVGGIVVLSTRWALIRLSFDPSYWVWLCRISFSSAFSFLPRWRTHSRCYRLSLHPKPLNLRHPSQKCFDAFGRYGNASNTASNWRRNSSGSPFHWRSCVSCRSVCALS